MPVLAMPRQAKLEQRARQSPGSLRFVEVESLARATGFGWRVSSRGHAVLQHGTTAVTLCIPQPHPGKHVKATYVLNLLAAIDRERKATEGDAS
ncbi:MAG: hypothetical protein IT204_00840 [Fimbriimonadaceae bacterium]|nr:hypothetical protein [Fimbriimonadaceae bacterium]